MPGIVVFGRRWSVGSDDLVVPALILVFVHVIWLTTLVLIFGNVEFELTLECSRELRDVVLGYIVILLVCIIVESVVTLVSIRGSILDVDPRASMQYLMYIRIVVGLGELSWLVVGIRWLARFFGCHPNNAGQAVLGMSVFNSFMILLGVLSVWCTFDSAGRKWVKFKRYQESMKSTTHRSRRSGGSRRNWRQRKAMRAYEESWDRRLGLMCCCVERKGRNKNSMSEIAQLFTEFFRDLDVVPSDVIAGLVLLRRFQRMRMQYTINQDVNDVYQYLSGVAVTPRTQFLQLGQPEVMQQYKIVIHYMKFAMAAYGWPLFVMMNTGTGLCRMMPYLRCCCCHRKCCSKGDHSDYELEDNCCECNVVALKKISGTTDMDLVYVSYHVDIGETPFYVALDKKHKKIVICVRGTLSLQDVLTDLKADAEVLPLDPVKEDWVAHKGMVQAAIYIKKKLKDDLILAKAFQKAKEQSDERYDLVLVGHSLGAGTAAILAILLHQEYQDLQCYAYSPPGGLLSKECMEATKTFITSVVIAKDIVPRIGLPQMELLRTDLINIIKKSKNPKWKIIMKALCCGTGSAAQFSYDDVKEDLERNVTKHPSDDQIGLTAHKAMFPPGKIILVVRKHSGGKQGCCGEEETVYQAIWADNSDFQEVLISPTMVNDHMPDNVLEALEKVLVNVAPPKPTRLLTEPERTAMLKHDMSPGTPEIPLTQLPTPVGNQHTVHVVSEKGTSEAENLIEYYLNSNNIGWDAATEELLLSLDRQHLFPGLGDNARLEMLDMESELIQAPLASPEGLSAASSMITLNRVGSLQKHEAKSESISLRLEPIEQSPEICVRTDEFLDSSNALEPQMVSGLTVKRMSLNESVSVCDFMKKGHLLGALQLDSIAHASQGSLNNLLPNVDYESSTEALDLYKDTTSQNDNGSNSGIEMNPGEEQILDAIEGKTNLTGHDVSQNCIPADQSGEFMKVKNDNNNYERHSPVENTQYGYFDPNEVYSAASLGYRPPQIAVSECKPSVRLYSPDSPKSSHPPNKVLQYSMSESRLKGLSDEYKMRRSTEEGDIAHLEDATTVFVHDDARKLLKTRDTEPAFDLKLLPKNFSDCRLYSVKETEGETNGIEESKVNNNAEIETKDKIQHAGNEDTCQYPTNIGSDQQSEILEKTNIDTGNDAVDDRTCLLERKESDDDKTVIEENRPSSENSFRNEITNLGRVSTLSSPDDADRRLFHSNSCHSTFASSTSGESEQRLSLISANSEDFPIVETDV